ncbi:limonene-1,2-epoxide hydrolase family protein [Gordonia sp. (in: high G+C Gram-positive bacteria)]|uniref:limonene-1,2-epoxide hydrolase family protein n=1 Tax=Gordonia sp. (in: high G+C Gram-positive bacteria) TaxID=84139 RepID=UPI003C75D7DF
MTSQNPTELVLDFFTDLAQHRVDAALTRVDDDIVYVNVGLPTVRGMRRFDKVMRALNRPGFGFDAQILAISSDDTGVVLTERLDELTIGPLRMQFWVCGRNEVREGQIVLWRDYFDVWNCTRGFIRGVAAIAIPALRKPLRDPLSARVMLQL